MKKLVNGQLVDLTDDEILARQSEEVAAVSEALDAYKSIYRDQKILEGITVSGVTIGGDDTTQNRLMAARILAKEDASYTVNWKSSNGFVSLNAAQVIVLADALRDHVQKCFDAENSLTGSYATILEVESAFDTAYSS